MSATRRPGPNIAVHLTESMPRLLIFGVFCLGSIAFGQTALFQVLDSPIPSTSGVEAVGDVDADGDLDILTPQGLLINDGNTRFTLVANLAFYRSRAVFADLNGDGLLDLVSNVSTAGL